MLDISAQDQTFISLKNWADRHQLCFDTIYTSNIPEWLDSLPYKHSTMKENICKLMSPQTYAISAWKAHQFGGNPVLHIQKGSHPEIQYTKKQQQKPTFNARGGKKLF